MCPVKFGCCRGWRSYGLSGLLLQNVTALMEKMIFFFFPKICLEMLRLGNSFEQRSEGLPVFKFLFRFFSSLETSSSVDLIEIKSVLGREKARGQMKQVGKVHEVTGISLAAVALEIKR